MKSVAAKFPDTLSDDKVALASIGQGDVLSTPLQNAMVAAAIANDGKLMRPTLVDRVRASDLSTLSEATPGSDVHRVQLQHGVQAQPDDAVGGRA